MASYVSGNGYRDGKLAAWIMKYGGWSSYKRGEDLSVIAADGERAKGEMEAEKESGSRRPFLICRYSSGDKLLRHCASRAPPPPPPPRNREAVLPFIADNCGSCAPLKPRAAVFLVSTLIDLIIAGRFGRAFTAYADISDISVLRLNSHARKSARSPSASGNAAEQ